MCFEIKKIVRAKIAKTDIECWKIVRRDYSPKYGGKMRSGNSHTNTTPYIVGVLNSLQKIRREMRVSKEDAQISKGYHSFKTKDNFLFMKGRYDKCCKFIIPFGTRYFENETEYVSENIILITKI